MAATGGGRRALLIGITDYVHARRLHGCVNDVHLMRAVLTENFGFPAEQVTVLENAQATRAGMLAAFDALAAATGPDDLVVIHYAGHGSQMTDTSGDESFGLDSTLVPIDSEGHTGTNLDISDDELAEKLEAIGAKTRFITLIIDACHSGTITRDVLGSAGRTAPPDRRPRTPRAAAAKPIPASATRGRSGWLPLSEKYVVLSGCRDDEIAQEFVPPGITGDTMHGALTYYLAAELRKAVPGTTYRDVFERAAAQVTAAKSSQHPQMEGMADREVFGTREIVPSRFVRITAREGALVRLAAGRAQGVTVGSRYAIHPQGTKAPADAPALGEIVITAVGVTAADATITQEPTPGSIGADTRAFETAHAFGDFRLAVAFADPAAAAGDGAALHAALTASSLLHVVPAGPAVPVTVHCLPPRRTVAPTDPVPRAGPLAEAQWAVAGEHGDLLMPLKPLTAAAEICANLEKIARYRQALALENPDPDSRLRGKITLDLLRRDASGTWANAVPDPTSGYVTYDEGEAIAFRVDNAHDEDLFMALIDFGMTGAITVLRPSRTSGQSQEMLGKSTRYTIGENGKMTIIWNPAFPFVTTVDAANTREALGAVKLFVTQHRADFTVLRQDGVRSGDLTRTSSPLGDLLHRTFQGPATRDISEDLTVPPEPLDQDWTTVVRPYLVRRSRV